MVVQYEDQFTYPHNLYPVSQGPSTNNCSPNYSLTSPSGTVYLSSIPCDPNNIIINTHVGEYCYTAYDINKSTACGTSDDPCVSYNIIACLETSNDPQADKSEQGVCTGAVVYPASYTVTNSTL